MAARELRSIAAGVRALLSKLGRYAYEATLEQPAVVGAAVYAIVRATARTVKTGTTGLLFSFGRAARIVEPGLCYMIPFLQTVRVLPTRARTLDLPAQRVGTRDGLVFLVDVNLIYRITDVRRALIEVDDIDRAIHQLLGLSVQEVLGRRSRDELRAPQELDGELARAMDARLAPWGAVVVRTGFTSIRPSPVTLRVTQLALAAAARRDVFGDLVEAGVPPVLAPALVGTPRRWVPRSVQARSREVASRRARRLRRRVTAELRGRDDVDARARSLLVRRAVREGAPPRGPAPPAAAAASRDAEA